MLSTKKGIKQQLSVCLFMATVSLGWKVSACKERLEIVKKPQRHLRDLKSKLILVAITNHLQQNEDCYEHFQKYKET